MKSLIILFLLVLQVNILANSTHQFTRENTLGTSLEIKIISHSDDLFFFENVPIRLILDTDINNPDTTNLTPFLENSEKITDSLREHIINKFHEHREVDYDEQKIIRFTQKVYLTCDGQEYLTAAVYLPWIKGGILNIQISSTGQIHEVTH